MSDSTDFATAPRDGSVILVELAGEAEPRRMRWYTHPEGKWLPGQGYWKAVDGEGCFGPTSPKLVSWRPS